MGKRTRRKLSKSEAMARVRQRDTLPEVLLRRELWSRGLRYRLNQRIAGTRPDLVFVSDRLVVFVDGCFWHSCPLHGTTPATNQGFWADKLRRNAERDAEHNRALRQAGWRVLRLWEHEILEGAATAAGRVIELLREGRSGEPNGA